jgi:hypothetical protein
MMINQWIFYGVPYFQANIPIISSRKSQHQTQQNTRIFQMYSMTVVWDVALNIPDTYIISSIRTLSFTGMVGPSCQSHHVTTIARPE